MKTKNNYSQPQKVAVDYYQLASFSGIRLAMIPAKSFIKIQGMYFKRTQTGMIDASIEEIKKLLTQKPKNL